MISRMNGQVNHMDSIARPTSKVIQPPGGSSSGIFGANSETFEHKIYAEGNRKNESDIFGFKEAETPKPKTPPKPEEVNASFKNQIVN